VGDELKRETERLFDSVDRKDFEALMQGASKEIQSVDEVEDVHTTVGDVHETVLGDTGLVTCWIEQDYSMEGKPQHVSAPTTLVFRHENGAWKFLLFHSLPLPPEQ
jgi:ketosteroid isomerase-like protein